jgi:hypothetical protein
MRRKKPKPKFLFTPLDHDLITRARERFQQIGARPNTIKKGTRHASLQNYMCFSSLIQLPANIKALERVALGLEGHAIANEKEGIRECLFCDTIEHSGHRVTAKIRIYCPTCHIVHKWTMGLTRLLLNRNRCRQRRRYHPPFERIWRCLSPM